MTSNSATMLKDIVATARPMIAQQMDLAEQIAGLRDLAANNGFDWSQIKALLKAAIKDEREDTDKHVTKLLERADFALAYAGMLGLGKVNKEINSDDTPSTRLAPPAVSAAEPSTPSDDVVPEPDGQPDGLAWLAGNQPEAAPNPEPVAQPPCVRDGQPPAGSPNSRPVGGDPYADRQPPPIPDFLRRDRA